MLRDTCVMKIRKGILAHKASLDYHAELKDFMIKNGDQRQLELLISPYQLSMKNLWGKLLGEHKWATTYKIVSRKIADWSNIVVDLLLARPPADGSAPTVIKRMIDDSQEPDNLVDSNSNEKMILRQKCYGNNTSTSILDIGDVDRYYLAMGSLLVEFYKTNLRVGACGENTPMLKSGRWSPKRGKRNEFEVFENEKGARRRSPSPIVEPPRCHPVLSRATTAPGLALTDTYMVATT
ncbi:hypothetical protein Scep_012728 [Stephania cephalantha]|uniref:Uncharacterized protein n=1 Tax=Stephania cephalantha TaxID=152367 RepID=A0AAP0JHP0_9MAGN